MRYRQPIWRATALVILLGLQFGLTACQTENMARRSFPPDKRASLQSGGPHEGTAETMTVIVNYR